jgi:hypothetical protein
MQAINVFSGPVATGTVAAAALQIFGLPRRMQSPPSPAARLTSGLTVLRREQSRNLYATAIRSTNDLADQASRHLLEDASTLTGTWRKDREASDPMTEACDMVALPWILRQALNVLEVLHVEETQEHFKTVMKAGGVLDVAEKYRWDGEAVEHSRRDKRRGKHVGRVRRTEDGHPCIEVSWDDPYGGVCCDEFQLSSCGSKLVQVTNMTVGEKSTLYKTVYRRARQA